MGLDSDAAFSVIQRALEEFSADVGKARAGQAQAEETLASVEYELDQLRALIAENALPPDTAPAFANSLSDVQILREEVGSGLLRRLVGRAA
ncbi:hypothetical protein [uncultured Hyphomicrobium sp.]|uniref:hypothetical protein n=1 Tax=uncultured Hyphomicrobium sp. TaxID=194373 RepID=UPI0025FB2DBF|nr:hypothetical protein [uncultured Hyphomicrobium sp.]